ncbi:MAG TPA: hypothetical protein VFB85_12845, partial [Vicinamibacterales bacterium]|nr:hypothetical protein [Vicinamibacterales bacterium]
MTRLLMLWAVIRRSLGTVLSALRRGVVWLARSVAWLFALVFGRVDWHAPTWLRWARARAHEGRAYLVSRPKVAGGLALAVVAAVGAIAWYVT